MNVLEFCDSFQDKDFNVSIVVVLSHGENGAILASDDKEMGVENDIIGRFNNKDCPALKGKPKLFLFLTNLVETEKDSFKTFYMRRKVKNALAIQSIAKEHSRSVFVDYFCRSFERLDFANIDNPLVEETSTSINQAGIRKEWLLKINQFQFDKISGELFSRLKTRGFPEEDLITYL
eukprot:GFUD01132610.1.p1 GENE.GFUD01132610.1~~GFUD01132610.1.p1  ORF type:complete len:177 (+),score=34.18 GFUD01132610.1:1-531(+)